MERGQREADRSMASPKGLDPREALVTQTWTVLGYTCLVQKRPTSPAVQISQLMMLWRILAHVSWKPNGGQVVRESWGVVVQGSPNTGLETRCRLMRPTGSLWSPVILWPYWHGLFPPSCALVVCRGCFENQGSKEQLPRSHNVF